MSKYPNKTHMGEALRIYLWQNDISLRELGKRLNISPATLSRYINGHDITAQHFITLLNWFTGTINPPIKEK